MAGALLWLGEQRDNPVKRDRRRDFVMDTVINYYESDMPKLPYIPGHLFLDNGAFTAALRGEQLKTERVIEVQEALDPDRTIPLDYPFKGGMTDKTMRTRWRKTAQNILYWQESTSLSDRLVPALHAWNKSSLLENVRWLQKHADSDYVALGSLVAPDFTEFAAFFGDRQPRPALVDMLVTAVELVEKHSDFRVHVMGFGSSPLMLHLAYYLGAQSTDSAGFRRKAAFGKIIIAGVAGERYTGNSTASFGTRTMSHEELDALRRCGCETCLVSQDSLWAHWKARALHNEFVLKQEALRAGVLVDRGLDAYEAYLETVFGTSSLLYLWEYAKLKRRYHKISTSLFAR